jgi:hypothetical protein
MHFSHDKDISDECRRLLSLGWRAVDGGKHWKLYTPSGRYMVPVPGTPGDRRSLLNFKSGIRRIARMEEEYVQAQGH